MVFVCFVVVGTLSGCASICQGCLLQATSLRGMNFHLEINKCSMQYSVLNDLARAKRRWTEKKANLVEGFALRLPIFSKNRGFERINRASGKKLKKDARR